MWALFFVVGSLSFFILCALVTIALFFAVETDSPFWAAFTLGAYFTALYFFGDFNILTWVHAHPYKMLMYTIGFFVTGTFWSVIKWWFFVREKRDCFNGLKLRFIKSHSLGLKVTDKIPADKLGMFADFLANNSLATKYKKPDPSYYKKEILTWMIYWPWSMAWTLINDPIKKLFKIIYSRISRVYDRISDHMYSDVHDEINIAEATRQRERHAKAREDSYI